MLEGSGMHRALDSELLQLLVAPPPLGTLVLLLTWVDSSPSVTVTSF